MTVTVTVTVTMTVTDSCDVAQEVIKYVEALKDRVTALETAQNLPLSCPPTTKEVLPIALLSPAVECYPPGAQSGCMDHASVKVNLGCCCYH